MNDAEAFRERSTAFELKLQSKPFEPKEAMHDPVVFFDKGWIIFFSVSATTSMRGLKSLVSCKKDSDGIWQDRLEFLLRRISAVKRNCPSQFPWIHFPSF